MVTYYILNEDHSTSVADSKSWARRFERDDRTVDFTEKGDVEVSTVFLGIDHRFGDYQGQPLLFETMVFGGEHDGYQERCSTWDEAVEMHKRACKLVWPTRT